MDRSLAVAAQEKILSLESRIRQVPGHMVGDCCPLKHSFAKGIYIREITMAAGLLIISKTHKYSHAAFLMKGKVSVLDPTGPVLRQAPEHWITPAGTKRALYIHEEAVWVTVHATELTDLEDIEDEIIDNSQYTTLELTEVFERLQLEED